MRTTGGLVLADPQFRTGGGLVDCGTAQGGGGGGTGGLSASASPSAVYGSVASGRTARVSTNGTTVAVSGGTAPYAYAWDNPSDWTVNSSGGYATFSALVIPGDEKTETFPCSVTDAKGVVTTASVLATVSNSYSGGPRNAQV